MPFSQGLIAVASSEGVVKVSGAPGVELVLEEGGSLSGEDPPAYLVFPTPHLLVGVSTTGSLLIWDLAEGRRSGCIPHPVDPAGLEECVTAVHAPRCADQAADTMERYVFMGFRNGRVRVAQVFPVHRASGYVVGPREMAVGAPLDVQAPGFGSGGGASLGAVTSIASSGSGDGGSRALIGHQHGGIVLWDWVRRKRLAISGVASGGQGYRDQGAGEEDGDREVTSLAFHPSGGAYAAGFASGCYAVFAASSSDLVQPRWVNEVGDDGSYPREGPAIVRTPVSSVHWVGVRGREARAWGLLVAGGIEIEEGEEPDGVSLLVPPSAPADESIISPSGRGGVGARAKKHVVVAAALAALETAVFVPFAIGQERLSHVHAVVSDNSSMDSLADQRKGGTAEGGHSSVGEVSPGRSSDAGLDGDEECTERLARDVSEEGIDASEELVVLGLVTWKEEARGDDGRLFFRHVSSVQACPIQTAPYVALLQLAPERLGPHLSGFASVTAIAASPLLSSSTIRDFLACLGTDRQHSLAGGAQQSSLLRGGGLRWADSVPQHSRDETLCTSELLVVGHSNGMLSFWECCGPASRHDGMSISNGRVLLREVPSGAALLGYLPAAEVEGGDGIDVAVTALDVWVEREHVGAAERNACWVAVGFDSGNATVLVLARRMDAGSRGFGGDGRGFGSGGGTPLVEKAVEVSDVQLRDGVTVNGNSGRGGRWKRLVGAGRQQARAGEEEDVEDTELNAAIAKARAEARAIEEQEELSTVGRGGVTTSSPEVTMDRGKQRRGLGEKEQGGGGGDPELDLRQELSDAMLEQDVRAVPPASPLPPKPTIELPKEAMEGPQQQQQEYTPRRASLVQLALRLHGHPVRCVALSFDSCSSALALVVADAEGVVSVTNVSTGVASLLPMRAPQTRPCHPSIAVGPLPSALGGVVSRNDGHRRRVQQGAAGALFVFLEGWLNVFDLGSRDPIDLVQVPGLTRHDESGGGRSGGRGGGGDGNRGVEGNPVSSRGSASRLEDGRTWMTCVDERGVPLMPYASEPLSSLTPPPAPSPRARQGSDLSDGTGIGRGSREVSSYPPRPRMQTTWVSPSASRTALEGYHEHELQVLSDAPPPRSFLLVVRGAAAVVLDIAERDAAIMSQLSRRASTASSRNVAAFKGRSGADLVLKARVDLPRAEGCAFPPRMDGAGVCMVPAGEGGEGKAALRGCLVTVDASGFVTGLLLPSLSPVFRERLPAIGDGAGLAGGAVALAQKSACNLVGELTVHGTAGVSNGRMHVSVFELLRGGGGVGLL